MSSRSGSNLSHIYNREPSDQDENPPSPPPPQAQSYTISRSQARSRNRNRAIAAAARRAERIRNLENHPAGPEPLPPTLPSLHQIWTNSTIHAERLIRRDSDSSNLADLDRSLDQANSHLRALLDITNHTHTTLTNTAMESTRPPLEDTQEPAEDSRRHKRRKIELERSSSGPKSFRYGRYGQVDPGQLRMEIVSCDGGSYSGGSTFIASNILKSDDTVYCTKGSRCNIVLKHDGATPFSLQELIIKAPAAVNYSHPSVREGMVFVSMDDDELLNRTAKYQIQYTASPKANSETPEVDEPRLRRRRGDFANYMRGDAIRDSTREPTRESTRASMLRNHEVLRARENMASYRARRSYYSRAGQSEAVDDNDEVARTAQMPPEFDENVPEFTVTTQCSDDEGAAYTLDLETPFRASHGRPPNRIGALPFENHDSDYSDDSQPLVDGPLPRLSDYISLSDDPHASNNNNGGDAEAAPHAAFTYHSGFYPQHVDASGHRQILHIEPHEVEAMRNSLRDESRHWYNSQNVHNQQVNSIYHHHHHHHHDPPHPYSYQYQPPNRLSRYPPDRQPALASSSSLSEALEASTSATQDALRAVSGSGNRHLLAPHARFYIEEDKSKCTIRFDPPVSGRFILLKMWAAHNDPSSNIDIQSVLVRGFAGSRYFPSVELQ